MATTVAHSTAVRIDWIERIAIASLFAFLVFMRRERLIDPETRIWFLLYLVSEGLVVFFILIRRRTDDVTMRPTDWGLAIIPTFLPMLVTAGGNPLVPIEIGVTLVLTGMICQLSAKLMLRRSFGLIAANRGIKMGGPYRLVRHPMYAGYLLTHIGLLLTSPLMLNLVLYTVAWSAQVLRIMAEERLLGNDPKYRNYSERVRSRLIPGVF